MMACWLHEHLFQAFDVHRAGIIFVFLGFPSKLRKIISVLQRMNILTVLGHNIHKLSLSPATKFKGGIFFSSLHRMCVNILIILFLLWFKINAMRNCVYKCVLKVCVLKVCVLEMCVGAGAEEVCVCVCWKCKECADGVIYV